MILMHEITKAISCSKRSLCFNVEDVKHDTYTYTYILRKALAKKNTAEFAQSKAYYIIKTLCRRDVRKVFLA